MELFIIFAVCDKRGSFDCLVRVDKKDIISMETSEDDESCYLGELIYIFHISESIEEEDKLYYLDYYKIN